MEKYWEHNWNSKYYTIIDLLGVVHDDIFTSNTVDTAYIHEQEQKISRLFLKKIQKV